VILACGMVASSMALSRFAVKIQTKSSYEDKKIEVKGVAERTVKSDLASLHCNVTVKNPSLKDGYAAIDSAYERLMSKIQECGFSKDEILDESLSYYPEYITSYYYENQIQKEQKKFSLYLFRRSLRIKTSKVDLMAKNYLKLNSLMKEGISIELNSPEYYISNPEQYKLELLDEATISARNRAQTIAGRTGGKITGLIHGRQGVIQIIRPASTDSDDGGYYDVTSVDKVIRLVVSLQFSVE